MGATCRYGIEWDGQRRGGQVATAVAVGRQPSRFVAAGLTALLLAAPLAGLGKTKAAAPDASVIVRAVPGAAEAVERLIAKAGGTVARRIGVINGFSATVPADKVAELRAQAGVAAVTPNVKGHLMSVDPTLGYDTASDTGALSNIQTIIDANPAYTAGLTGKGVDVALIDSGVSPVAGLDGPGKVVNGVDVSFDSQNPNTTHLDGFGHGTHMAGIIAGKDAGVTAMPDAARFAGIAPDARIINVKAGAADGSVDVSQLLAAINWVVEHKNDTGMNIRVLNLSFGTDSPQDYTLDPLAYAAEVAWRKGIVVVVSGGNDGKNSGTLADPAIDPYVIAVGAEDPNGTVPVNDDAVAAFSSRGNSKRHVDFVAPGRSVISLRDPNSVIDTNNPGGRVGTRFFRGSGTSQATAVTSGAAALLLQQRPNLTPDQVKALLAGSAKQVQGGTLLAGSGLIDVGKAVVSATPTGVQNYTSAAGTGSLEAARGTSHVVDPTTGVALTGEQDIFGKPWNGSTWSGSTWSGSTWSGGVWNGSTWSGSTWSGSTWSGSTWSGSTWSGSTWSSVGWANNTWNGSTWSGSTWSGSTWSGSTWSGSTWSGSTWSGSTWSGSTWSGSTWSGSTWSSAGWE